MPGSNESFSFLSFFSFSGLRASLKYTSYDHKTPIRTALIYTHTTYTSNNFQVNVWVCVCVCEHHGSTSHTISTHTHSCNDRCKQSPKKEKQEIIGSSFKIHGNFKWKMPDGWLFHYYIYFFHTLNVRLVINMFFMFFFLLFCFSSLLFRI